MQNKFKAGDLVWIPNYTEYPVVIVPNPDNCEVYPLTVLVHVGGITKDITITKLGQEFEEDQLPSVFHVTRRNKELLDELYGIDLVDSGVHYND